MSERMSVDEPPDDWARGVLREAAARHRPDEARILTRVRHGMLDRRVPSPAPSPVTQLLLRSARSARGGRGGRTAEWLIPMVGTAAAVMLVAVGAVAVTDWSEDRPSNDSSSAAPGSTPAPSTDEPTGTPGATTLEPAGGVSSSRPESSETSRPSSTDDPSSGPDATGQVIYSNAVMTVRTVHDDKVRLGPSSGLQDWLVPAGDGPDGVVGPSSGPRRIEAPQTRSAVVEIKKGPFQVSWSDGYPRSTGAGVTSWYVARSAGGSASVSFDVGAGPASGDLVVSLGFIDRPGLLKVSTNDGRVRSWKSLGPNRPGATQSYQVTVHLGGVIAGRPLTVELTSGAGGAVGVAALALQ